MILLLIAAFFVFNIVELASRAFPKKSKPVVRGVAYVCIGWIMFSSGIFGSFGQKPQTVATLIEQAHGDEIHWNREGKLATFWEKVTHRHYKKSCQIYALEQLGELGPEATNAVPELVEIFNRLEDYNTGDGVLFLQSTAGKALGLIGHPDAIEPLIGMLKKKSLSSEPPYGGNIRWHDETYERDAKVHVPQPGVWAPVGRSYLKRGTGPQGIMMALMLMPREYHSEIVEQLKMAYTEIENSEHFNAWSKFEIKRAIQFFESDEKTRTRVRDYVACCWYLDDADLEKLLDPEYVRPTFKPRVLYSNGKWADDISPEEAKELIPILKSGKTTRKTSESLKEKKVGQEAESDVD